MVALDWYNSTTASGNLTTWVIPTASASSSSGVVIWVEPQYWNRYRTLNYQEWRKQRIAEIQLENYLESRAMLLRKEFLVESHLINRKGYKPHIRSRYDLSTRNYQKRKRRLHETK